MTINTIKTSDDNLPAGWIKLSPTDIIRKGDMFWSPRAKMWVKSELLGCGFKVAVIGGYTYIRKIKKKQQMEAKDP